MAPRLRPNPCTKPVAILPLRPWRSTTATFTTSCPRSGSTKPSALGNASRSWLVMMRPALTPITDRLSRPGRAATRKSPAVTAGALTEP